MTEWANAPRMPWTAAAGWHMETRDWHTHHDEIGFSSEVLSGSRILSVAMLYSLHGKRPPPHAQGRGSAVCVRSQTVREKW